MNRHERRKAAARTKHWTPERFDLVTDDALGLILDGLKGIVDGAAAVGVDEADLAIIVPIEWGAEKYQFCGGTRAEARDLLTSLERTNPVGLLDSFDEKQAPTIPIVFVALDGTREAQFAQLGSCVYSGGQQLSAGGDA